MPCGDRIFYNLTTKVISLWDNKIYLDLDLKNVDDWVGGLLKVELSDVEKCEGFSLFKRKAASSVFISGNRAEARGQVARTP